MLYSGTDPESYITECTLVYEDKEKKSAYRFRGGPVFKAHRLLHHSIVGLRVTKRRRVRTRLLPLFVTLKPTIE